MNSLRTQTFLRTASVVFLLSALGPLPNHATARQILKVWRTVYQQLNPGVEPVWRSEEDAIAWAKGEEDRLEPIVMTIIRGEDPGTQWTAGLAIAKHIPTPAICDLLLEKSELVIGRAPNGVPAWNSVDERGLANIIEILSAQRSEAIRPLVVELVARPGQSSMLMERCLHALQKIGNREDLAIVAHVRTQNVNGHISRLCELTEKLIDARLVGGDLLANATERLRAVTDAWIAAIEASDMHAYLEVLPFSAKAGLSEYDFKVELLQSRDLSDLLEAAKAISREGRFDVDRENLRADCVFGDRYRFIYVYEVDGWKLAGMERIEP